MAAPSKFLKRFFRRTDDGSIYFVWNASDEVSEKVTQILERAAYHWRRGELESAIEHAEAAIHAEPEYPQAHLLALVYGIEGERHKYVLQCIERLPDVMRNAMPFTALAAIAVALTGQQQEADNVLSKLPSQSRTDAFFHFSKAEVAYVAHQWQAASTSYNELYQIDPGFPYGHIHAAKAFLQQGEYRTAVTLLEYRLKTQPRNAEVYHMLGCTYEQLGDAVRARQMYRETLAIEPNRWETLFRMGRLERQAKQLSVAIQHLHAAWTGNPESVEIARELLIAYIESGNWSDVSTVLPLIFTHGLCQDDARWIATALEQGEALDFLETQLAVALRNQPQHPQLLYLWGLLASRKARYVEAQRALEAASKLLQTIEVYLALARVYAATGQTDSAICTYNRVLERDPQNVTALVERCQLRIRVGELSDALVDIEAALVISPDSGILHYLRARCLMEMGKTDQALVSVMDALHRDPTLTDAWMLSSELWRERGEYAQAIFALKQVLTHQPDNVAALIAMAETQLAIGRLNAAKQHIEHVLHLQPERGEELYLMLGKSLEKRNLLNRALDLYEDALQHYPSSIELRFRCGVTALKCGAIQLCSTQIEQLAQLDPIRAATLRDVYSAMLATQRHDR
ncbi:MAG: tetratricopeptide repeat protein [Chlorobi bacterium]|nr:tetratricopeptide repeat protein [Chlorobiota bacterium]